MDVRAELRAELTRLARDWRREDIGFFAGVAVSTLALALAVVLIIGLSPWFLLAALPPALAAVRAGVRRRPLVRFARMLEVRYPIARGILVPGIQLALLSPDHRERYSEELLAAAAAQARRALAEAAPRPRFRLWAWAGAAAGFAALAVFGAFAPRTMLLHGLAAFAPARITVVLDAPRTVSRARAGDTILVSVGVRSELPVEHIGLVVRPDSGPAQSRRLAVRGDSARTVLVVRAGLECYATAYGRRGPAARVDLRRPVKVRELHYTVLPPPYTRLAAAEVPGPNIIAPAGSRLRINGTASQALARAGLQLADRPAREFAVAGDRFQDEFAVPDTQCAGRIELVDRSGNRATSDTFRILPLPDQIPVVTLFEPGRSLDLPATMKLALGVELLDDYGLGPVYLVFAKPGRAEQRVLIRPASGRRADSVWWWWDLSQLAFLPGEKLTYYALAYDNNARPGPQAGRSGVFELRFPSIEEIYQDVARASSGLTTDVTSLAEEQGELARQTERVEDAVKERRTLTWSEQQRLGKLLGTQQDLLGRVAELSAELTRLKENLEQGMVLDREALAKVRELGEILDRIATKPVRERLTALSAELARARPELLARLGELKMSQAELKASLDRALELLKQFSRDERLRGLAERAAQLARAQQGIQDALAAESTSQLAASEQEIARGLRDLERDTRALAAETDAALLDSLAQAMADQDLAARAGELARTLNTGNRSPAARDGGQLAQDLSRLSRQLAAARDRMFAARRAATTAQMLAAASDLVTLSMSQESLEDELGRGRPASDLVGAEQGLSAATRAQAEGLLGLASQTRAVPPDVRAQVIEALVQMDQSAQALSANDAGAARPGMAGARARLDRAAADLLNALRRSDGQGATGLESLLEQLAALTLDQLMLNQSAAGLLPIPIPGAGLSPEQQAALGRVRSQQAAIREQLAELAEAASGMPGLEASLNRIVEEMKQVETELTPPLVERTVIERQERILTHLLDASRSVRQRDFSEKRTREVGVVSGTVLGPGPLSADRGERNRQLRALLLRALQEDYPPEYEALIRAYFDALLQ